MSVSENSSLVCSCTYHDYIASALRYISGFTLCKAITLDVVMYGC